MRMREFYQAKVRNHIFEVDKRYTNLHLIGSGSYGTVASADDNVHKQKVAIKKICRVFDDATRAKRILREIKLLRHLNGHENVIQIFDIMVPPNKEEVVDIYIVTTLFETDLDQIISSKQSLSKRHLQLFLYQMLRGLKYIHSAGILHRDLKPSNILINANCDLAICDFGLARGTAIQNESCRSIYDMEACMTEYVVTRYYRAPELLCEATTYGKSIDIWSIGCIFAELICREPVFLGKSPVQQLKLIARSLPCPPSEELDYVQYDAAKKVIDESRRNDCQEEFRKNFEGVDKRAVNLLLRMLVIKPENRISIEEALRHPFLRQLHKRMEEPECRITFNCDFEQSNISIQETKALVTKEINSMLESEDC